MSKELAHNIDLLYNKVREIIESARNKVYRTANIEMVQAYWNVGREIVEEEQKGEGRAEYGKHLIEEISQRLTSEYGKGFDVRNLYYMRSFYTSFPKLNALRSELTWTHYRLLLRIEKEPARTFYLEETIAGNWSTRQLSRQVNSLFYDRTLISKDKRGMLQDGRALEDKTQATDIIKDPYVLEFLNIKESEKLAETELESALINKLQHFLLELGNGFAFVGRQYRISDGIKHYRIDLVFYNYILKCFLLIDLKTEELTHKDIGQMDFYVRYFEDNIKQPGDNPSIGLILCTEKSRTIVKYSLLNESKQIFASKYQMYLPSEKQLVQEIQREKEKIEQEKKLSEE
ncbi:MAG: PDDEXK nuclease domain-containing protein [Bacteroidales bacterium]|nr:PDDEXK nuclease domain-containing protein [Bacteroidales bacterium]MCF8458665.1 PDDEXK nuclease domain-containing protein [Bacteroidales bacterium]